MPPTDATAIQEPEEEAQAHPPTEAEIDLEALAEKVFRLLKEEIEVERERLGRHRVW